MLSEVVYVDHFSVTYQVNIVHFLFKKIYFILFFCYATPCNQPGIEQSPVHQKLRVLTAGPPGMSPVLFILY